LEASQLIIYLAGQISNCYSFIHADVTNSSDLSFHLGAIGGKNEGIIQNCYSDATLASIQNADRNNIISGIVGENMATGLVNKCISKSSLQSTSTSPGNNALNILFLGGIVALNHGGTIQSCYNYGEIYGTTTESAISSLLIGGITAQNKSPGLIQSCSNIGNINFIHQATQFCYIGGISANNQSDIISCSSTDSTISGIAGENTTLCYVSGIAGINTSNISESYNTSNIQINSACKGNTNVGGISACNYTSSFISNCHNNGKIEASCSYTTIDNSYVLFIRRNCWIKLWLYSKL
jgi:hypothetical protein